LSHLFDFKADYREYLRNALATKSKEKRGERNRLATALNCQPAFVSQVLHDRAHFNLEHGAAINRFLHHNPEESHYFLLLLQRTRAGTEDLRRYFDDQINEILRRRLVLSERFKVAETISAEDKSVYYSSWVYGAIRVLLTIPEFRDRDKIASRLNLPVEKVSEVLDFLLTRGLISEVGGELAVTKTVMHLGNDSSMIAKHHSNWRIRAISSLDSETEADLHYSSAVSLSRADALEIKKMMIAHLEKVRAVVKGSPAEDVFSVGLDFFRL
jgi:uncharacterized protein (TIGR02147 family)